VSRRARAIAFACAALACAGLAAAIAGGYRGDVASQFGDLRPVVVARGDLAAGRPLRPADAGRLLELRRVPARFAPIDALDSIEGAIGLVPRTPVAAGAYLLASQLRPPGRPRGDGGGTSLPPGREPVDIAVRGAEPLVAAGDPAGIRVDVIVTTEPGPGGGPGRTYLAAEAIPLLALGQPESPGADPGGAPVFDAGGWTATLALTRAQAIRLIQAESFARQIRLIRHPGR
jgi:Flp pilus assembly protein CpaB